MKTDSKETFVLSENNTPVLESQKSLATLVAVSRRLGVTSKQLKRFISKSGVEPSDGDLYDIELIVQAIESLSASDRLGFKSAQKPVSNASDSLYKDKFSVLLKYAPPAGSKNRTQQRRNSANSNSSREKLNAAGVGEGGKRSLSDLTDKELAALSGFESPMTSKHLSSALQINLKAANEAIYGSGLPTSQLKNILVVDLSKEKLGSFIANLPDGVREKTLIAQRNKNCLTRKRLADLLSLTPANLEKFLQALPGSPSSLSLEALEYVKTLPQYDSILKSIDDGVKEELVAVKSAASGRRRRRSSGGSEKASKTVTLLQIAERYSISEEEAVLLAKRRFFPRYNSTEGNVHISASKIPDRLVDAMIDGNCYTLYSMAKELKVSPHRLESQLLKDKIKPVRSFLLKYDGLRHKIILYSELVVENFKRSESYRILTDEEEVHKAQVRAERKLTDRELKEREKQLSAHLQEIEDRVYVDARERSSAPAKTVFYVGPTNSGKTYNSLNELFDEYERNEGRGKYVYAGPLRMLAFEVYEKMAARYGEEAVGFLTGEEQINPEANMLACTVEMAPDEGTSLVLDEAHWIVDADRGQHWTHLLMGGKYTNMHILTAKEALPTLEALVSDSENISSREFQRRTPIVYGGEISLKQIPPRSAVVAFSRKSVYAIAGDLARAGRKVGVLYGALPLKVRKAQIEKYVEGVYDIMVTTDVIGHGINLPIDNVVFAQTEKFDGRERRQIHIWEAAQIAGRAGRYGLSVSGNVYGLTGRGWYSKNTELMKAGTLAAGGMIETDLIAEQALMFPRLGDLSVNNATELPHAVVSWQQKAFALMQDRPVVPSDLSTEYKLFEKVAEVANIPQYQPKRDWVGLPANTVWQLMSGPFSSKGTVIVAATRWLMEDNPQQSDALEKYFDKIVIPVKQVLESGRGLHKDSVALFEGISSDIGELKMVHIMFEGSGTLRMSELEEYEDIIDSLLIRSLGAAVKSSKYGRCDKCNRNCSPWFSLCDRCSFETSWW